MSDVWLDFSAKNLRARDSLQGQWLVSQRQRVFRLTLIRIIVIFIRRFKV